MNSKNRSIESQMLIENYNDENDISSFNITNQSAYLTPNERKSKLLKSFNSRLLHSE